MILLVISVAIMELMVAMNLNIQIILHVSFLMWLFALIYSDVYPNKLNKASTSEEACRKLIYLYSSWGRAWQFLIVTIIPRLFQPRWPATVLADVFWMAWFIYWKRNWMLLSITLPTLHETKPQLMGWGFSKQLALWNGTFLCVCLWVRSQIQQRKLN